MPSQRPRQRSIDVDEVLDLLSDDYAVEILGALDDSSATATELTDRCSGSKVTVYRRLNRLEAANLVRSRTRIRGDGNHCRVYQCVVRNVTISITDEGVEGDITLNESSYQPDDRVQ